MEKVIAILLVLFVYSFGFSQDINQFDENGKRHGVWKKTFKNTNVLRYEGEFLHGKEIGVFKFYKNIRKKAVLTATRTFNENDNKTYVKFFASRGKVISEGKMDGKLYMGEWKYYQKNSDKLLILENYNDKGNLEGERHVYYPNGQVAEKQNYVDGKLEGISTWYASNDVVLKTYVYVNGELHGESKFYNSMGDLITEGRYKHGKKHGIWKYYENGKLKDEKNFSPEGKYKKKTLTKKAPKK
ncbi:toxin-antitoxin system YwqK family antitoxin [Flavivirga amylovorans]|uniref:Toxin-antitoxin system YwqK family antitoxin n=1 Tax=Flavivirga amylovorans TaxID=870486 RepID=A0ABT8X3X4_9FLAO|nr:toxin-antitoxin system YwqK family antitoxin [Flavivirga amylovorans]MDO5988654.1 toxin-antitoxin system YwqK family antitoxin [Flavivirga amylovorans]